MLCTVPPDNGESLLQGRILNFEIVAFALQGIAHRAGSGRALVGEAEEPVGGNTKFSAY